MRDALRPRGFALHLEAIRMDWQGSPSRVCPGGQVHQQRNGSTRSASARGGGGLIFTRIVYTLEEGGRQRPTSGSLSSKRRGRPQGPSSIPARWSQGHGPDFDNAEMYRCTPRVQHPSRRRREVRGFSPSLRRGARRGALPPGPPRPPAVFGERLRGKTCRVHVVLFAHPLPREFFPSALQGGSWIALARQGGMSTIAT